MSAHFPPSDDELHGFLDGELQPDRRSAIETFLKTSPVHAERVEGWRRQKQIICAAFAPIEAEPAPASIMLPPPAGRRAFLHLLRPCPSPSGDLQPPARRLPFWRKGAAAAVKLWRACAKPLLIFAIFLAGAIAALAGAYFADQLHAPPVDDIRASAPISADDILASRTIAALMDFKPQDRANASGARPEKSLRGSHQASFIVPNLSSAGFALIGMRAAPAPALSGEPVDEMFCLFYAKAAEPAVALCIARDADNDRPARFHVAGKSLSNGPGGAISWRQANAIYTLAGPLDEAELRNLANRVSAEIEAFD